MTYWDRGVVCRSSGSREYTGEMPVPKTEEERVEIAQRLKNRRLGKTIKGKRTYQKKRG